MNNCLRQLVDSLVVNGKTFRILIPLAAGVAAAFLTLSHVIKYLLANHYEPTQFFFLGLIISILPMLMREADAKSSFKGKHIVLLIVAAILVAITAFFKPDKANRSNYDVNNFKCNWFIFRRMDG